MSETDKDIDLKTSEPDETQVSTEQATGEEQAEPFRMPMDSPQHLRGKTPEEIVEWSNTVTDGVRQLYAQQQQTQQAAGGDPRRRQDLLEGSGVARKPTGAKFASGLLDDA